MKYLKCTIKEIPHFNSAFFFTAIVSLFVGSYFPNGFAETNSSVTDNSVTNNNVDIESVYRIELIVFADARRDYQSSEHWQTPKELSYPKQLIFITDSESINLSTEISPQVSELEPQATIEPNTLEGDFQKKLNTVIPPLMVSLDEEPQLSAIANTLKRRSRYQLLFHKYWYQSLQSKKEAPAIVINGGTAFGNHFQLEGSVIISKGRFLHITSDLWFIDWESRDKNQRLPWYLREDSNNEIYIPNIPLATTQNNNQQFENDDDSLPSWEEELNDATYNERYVNSERFRATNVYTLREYRRMKRDEIHYLDHPLFGVVVVISKYEQPEPDEELSKQTES